MDNVIKAIVYKSKTGHTEKYAKMIGEKLNIPCYALKEAKTKLMKNDEISEKFTEREVRERVEREWNQKNDDETLDNFRERVEDDIETDAQYMRGERQ